MGSNEAIIIFQDWLEYIKAHKDTTREAGKLIGAIEAILVTIVKKDKKIHSLQVSLANYKKKQPGDLTDLSLVEVKKECTFKQDDPESEHWCCSECNSGFYFDDVTSIEEMMDKCVIPIYCSNCGAKIKEFLDYGEEE